MKTCVIFLVWSLLTVGATDINSLYKKNTTREPFFIENKGQWNENILFMSRLKGMDVWITRNGVVLTYFQTRKQDLRKFISTLSTKSEAEENHSGQRVILKFLDHNPQVNYSGKMKLKTYYNFFLGNNPSEHKSNVSLYREIFVKNIYHGINIRYYFDRGFLRFDFIVHPGSNPEQIRFKLEGQNDVVLDEHQIVFSTIFGQNTISELKTYQDSHIIPSVFSRENDCFSIITGSYDKTRTLVIDPVIFSAYVGGSGYDESYDIALDQMNNVYITGHTCSPDFDMTPGVFQFSAQGQSDVFVSKFNSTGTDLIFCTLIGGIKSESAYSLCIDADQNIYLTGETCSDDFPTINLPYQKHLAGKTDVFLVKLNSSGTSLIFSTLTGGNDNDVATELALDEKNNIYVTGLTYSDNFPVTSDAFQTTHKGGSDAFLVKFYPDGTEINYATLLGGSGNDISYGMAIGKNHCVYLTGLTSSDDFVLTAGALQTTYKGGFDGFIAKLDPAGSNLIFSTYIGGMDDDYGKKIVLDTAENIYVVGNTGSIDFPATPQVLQSNYSGGGDVFITKLNRDGDCLIFSTFLGGSSLDFAQDILLDKSGNVIITGLTASIDFPTLGDTTQLIFGGGYCDAFMSIINPGGNLLLYSTYAGGSDDEWSQALAIDCNNEIYITGATYSSDFALPENTFHSYKCGNGDIFIIKYTPVDLLPVEYLNIRAFWENNTAVIEWTTATEHNNYGFFIERIIDGKFSEVGFVPGSGNSQTMNTYLWYDESLYDSNESVFIYRIKQVDFNGRYAYSKPILLTRKNHELSNPNDLQIQNLFPCPVPTGSNLTLIFNSSAETLVQIELISSCGNSISKTSFSAEQGINNCDITLNDVVPGNYFINIKTSAASASMPFVVVSD